MLAVRTANSIEGGRAGVLPPERRERLVAMGTGLGLRTFDAHLVIAIVQDAARSGRDLVEPDTRERLAMLPAGDPVVSREEAALGIGLRLAVAALLAVAIVGVVIGWLKPV